MIWGGFKEALCSGLDAGVGLWLGIFVTLVWGEGGPEQAETRLLRKQPGWVDVSSWWTTLDCVHLLSGLRHRPGVVQVWTPRPPLCRRLPCQATFPIPSRPQGHVSEGDDSILR